MSIEVKDGKISVQIDGEYDVEALSALIDSLGEARAKLASDPDQPVEGKAYKLAADPRLWTFWGPHTNANFVLMTRFPELGWKGVVMTPKTASEIAILVNQYLAYYVAATSAAATEAASNKPPTGGAGGTTLH